jgi:hypothetical protein
MEARETFRRFLPSRPLSASGEPAVSYDISGGIGDH